MENEKILEERRLWKGGFGIVYSLQLVENEYGKRVKYIAKLENEDYILASLYGNKEIPKTGLADYDPRDKLEKLEENAVSAKGSIVQGFTVTLVVYCSQAMNRVENYCFKDGLSDRGRFFAEQKFESLLLKELRETVNPKESNVYKEAMESFKFVGNDRKNGVLTMLTLNKC